MIIEHSWILVWHSILMGFCRNLWIVWKSGVACWLPSQLRCSLRSILVATWHESLLMRLHCVNLLHDCLQGVARFCFRTLLLHAIARAVIAILRAIFLILILAILVFSELSGWLGFQTENPHWIIYCSHFHAHACTPLCFQNDSIHACNPVIRYHGKVTHSLLFFFIDWPEPILSVD